MKRNIIKLGFALLCLIGGMYFYSSHSEKGILNDIAFENIEALAQSEGDEEGENFRCYGWGDIPCHGIKVERKTGGLR